MNEHVTRAWERAKLIAGATDQIRAWSLLSDFAVSLRQSIDNKENEYDIKYALLTLENACADQVRAAAGSNATVIAESKADGWRLTQKPAPAWIDEAAAHDFNDES